MSSGVTAQVANIMGNMGCQVTKDQSGMIHISNCPNKTVPNRQTPNPKDTIVLSQTSKQTVANQGPTKVSLKTPRGATIEAQTLKDGSQLTTYTLSANHESGYVNEEFEFSATGQLESMRVAFGSFNTGGQDGGTIEITKERSMHPTKPSKFIVNVNNAQKSVTVNSFAELKEQYLHLVAPDSVLSRLSSNGSLPNNNINLLNY